MQETTDDQAQNNNKDITNEEIWRADPFKIEVAAITRFRQAINGRWQVDLKNYDDLHRFSCEESEKFYQSLWDYTRIIANVESKIIIEPGKHIKDTKFFPDARLNFAENMLARCPKLAIVFRGEKGQDIQWHRQDVIKMTAATVRGLRALGIQPGDRVGGILPNIPEAIIITLACLSLGAIWTSCSPDFGEAGILDRLGQIKPKVIFASDGYFYNGKTINIAEKINSISQKIDGLIQTVIVPFIHEERDDQKLNKTIYWSDMPEFNYDPAIHKNGEDHIDFAQLPFDHPAFIVYSSGTTGKPKCIVHKAGGCLLNFMKEHQLHANLEAGQKLFFFTTLGWMMWNWLISAMASEVTIMLFDGSPLYTAKDDNIPVGSALFKYVQDYGITHMGVSAKYIDAIRKNKLIIKDHFDLSSLQSILTTGSVLVEGNFDYIYENIKSDLHLASISGGTDILGVFMGGAIDKPVYRGEIQVPLLGMDIQILDDEQKIMSQDEFGELVCTNSFLTMPHSFWNDPDGQRYHQAYYGKFENIWCHGDYTTKSQNGGYIIKGRSDATLNPGGVRIGTADLYSHVEAYDQIMEAIAVGQEWDDDTRIILFLVLKDGATLDDELIKTLKTSIRNSCSPRHVPAKIIQINDIPRTRSGKITELAVRDIIHGRPIKNIEALANPEALQQFENIFELTT